jgi:hypothetical protein
MTKWVSYNSKQSDTQQHLFDTHSPYLPIPIIPINHALTPIPPKMNSTLLRTTALRSALRAAPKSSARAGVATTFVRGKATLPDLQCKCCLVFARAANH